MPSLIVFCSKCRRAVDRHKIQYNQVTDEQSIVAACHGAEETQTYRNGIPARVYFFKQKMKKICITGEAVVRFTQTLEVPEDEAADMLANRENLITNIETSEENMQIVEWLWIKGNET